MCFGFARTTLMDLKAFNFKRPGSGLCLNRFCNLYSTEKRDKNKSLPESS